MADLLRKTKSLYASTANSFNTGTGVTITPVSVSGLPTDTEITLTFDRVNSAGVETPSLMERIIGTISGGDFVVRTSPGSGRGADNTSDQAHTSPVVEYIPNAKDINDAIDGFLTEHGQDGTHDTSVVTTLTATQTLTNKRVTPRTGTATSSGTPTINTDNVDFYSITALAANITSMTTNLSGTPTIGQKLVLRIKDDGTARTIAWGASFASRGATLPTTTTISKTLYVELLWNSVTSTWDCIQATTEGVAGNVTTALARAYLDGAQDNLTDATFTKVDLDAESFDPGSNFASNAFTAPVTGYYDLKATISYNNVIADKRYHCAFYKNGSLYSNASTTSSTTDAINATHTDEVQLTAGDTIELYARADAGVNTVDLNVGSANTHLTVSLITT